MLARIVPRIDPADFDLRVGQVLPSLVENLGHDEREVRESSAHALVVYLRHASDVDASIRAVLTSALGHPDPALRTRILDYLHLIYATDRSDDNDAYLDAVFRHLRSQMSHGDDRSVVAFEALRNMRDAVGEQRMQKISSPVKTMGVHDSDHRKRDSIEMVGHQDRSQKNVKKSLQFLISSDLMERLCDRHDHKRRFGGAEELRGILKEFQDVERLVDAFPQILTLLSTLLNDINFKVTLTALDIYKVLIEKLKWRCEAHLERIVGDLVMHLGENKLVVRVHTSKVIAALVSVCGAAPVVTALLGFLREPPSSPSSSTRVLNPKARQGILNEVIIALFNFPSYEFDLYDVCSKVAPSLLDSKLRVRHAVLECLAVLAQAMGPSKLATVAAAIDAAAEPHHDTEAALAAVLARFARRQLPRVDADGRVEYSLRIDAATKQASSYPHHGRSRGHGFSEGADVDWIMAGSGSLLDSAGPRNGRSQAASFPNSPAPPRRIVSPGHVKNSLPWTEKTARPRIKDRLPSPTRQRDRDGVVQGGPTGHTDAHSPSLSSTRTTDMSNKTGSSSGDSSDVTTAFETAMGSPWTSVASEQSLDRLANTTGASYRILYSGSRTSLSDKTASRPLDKVAAMLGPNLLPSKLRPIGDVHTNHRSGSTSTTIVPLSAAVQGGTLHSDNWLDSQGTLPALPSRRNLLGPLDVDSPPVPTRPKLVRSSSGGRRRRSKTTSHMGSVESCTSRTQPSNHPADRGHSRISSSPDSREVSPTTTPFRSRSDSRLVIDGPRQSDQFKVLDGKGLQPSDTYRGHSVSDDYEDGNDAVAVEDYGARASVDSGVESLLRPNTSSPAIVRVLEKPRSLDRGSDVRSMFIDEECPAKDVTGAQKTGQNNNESWVFHTDNTVVSGDVESVITEGESVLSLAADSSMSSLDGSSMMKPLNGIGNGFNVVGKGMLPTSKVNGAMTVLASSTSHRQQSENCDADDDSLPSVHGRGVNGAAFTSGIPRSPIEDEDPLTTSLSRTTFNKMMHRKMEVQKEADRRKDVDRHSDNRDGHGRRGSTSWFDNDDKDEGDGGNRHHDNNNDGVEVNRQNASRANKKPQPKSPQAKPAPTRRKLRAFDSKKQLLSESGTLSGGTRTGGQIEAALVRAAPEETLQKAYAKLASDEWQSKVQGIRIVDALTKNSPDLIATDVHNVNIALVNEVKNLRSTVARAAIQCIAELFFTVKKHMENDLEMICRALLHKSGESNVFIKQDVEKALDSMVDAVTPQKACLALIVTGATHRNPAVRKITAQFVCALCEKLGAQRVLGGQKDVTERILPTAANFVTDGSPLTRYYGRKIFFMLMPSPEFDRAIKQHLQSNTLRNIQGILENLRIKGLGNIPNESASSKHLKISLK